MVNLANKKENVIFGNDSIVVQKFIAGIKGGRALDTTGYTEDVILAGHVIITDGSGTYKPMPLKADSAHEGKMIYADLPASHAYAGILVSSIKTSQPAGSIMTYGQVNEVALPYEVPTAFKTACPHIEFIKDEESK